MTNCCFFLVSWAGSCHYIDYYSSWVGQHNCQWTFDNLFIEILVKITENAKSVQAKDGYFEESKINNNKKSKIIRIKCILYCMCITLIKRWCVQIFDWYCRSLEWENSEHTDITMVWMWAAATTQVGLLDGRKRGVNACPRIFCQCVLSRLPYVVT